MENWWRRNETSCLRVSIFNYSEREDKQLQGHLVGPYFFNLTHERKPARSPVDSNGQVIEYQQIDHLTFLDVPSPGLALTDSIVTASVAAIHAKNLLLRSNLTEKLRNELERALNDTGNSILKVTTVEELLLTGRRSQLMSIINSDNGYLNSLLPYNAERVTNYAINSGKNESRFIAGIESIDGQSVDLKEVRDGHQFNPGVRKSQLLTFFDPSLCIFGHLLYNGTKVIHENTIYDFTLRSYPSDERWPASHLASCNVQLPIKQKVDAPSSHFKIEPVSSVKDAGVFHYSSLFLLPFHRLLNPLKLQITS